MATKKEIGINPVRGNTKKYAFKRFSKTGIPLKYKVEELKKPTLPTVLLVAYIIILLGTLTE
jgi:hypothetical protein